MPEPEWLGQGDFVLVGLWVSRRSHSWQANRGNSTTKSVKLCKQGSFFSICRVFTLPALFLLFFCSFLWCLAHVLKALVELNWLKSLEFRVGAWLLAKVAAGVDYCLNRL